MGAGHLLVMGAYGRWRWREWVFGGATEHVLRHTPVPNLWSTDLAAVRNATSGWSFPRTMTLEPSLEPSA